MAENPPRITPPQGNPGRTSLDEGLYVFRVVLLAGPALIMAWQAIRLAVPIIAAIPLAYLVGQSWCAWAYHKGRSPKIIMVANYFKRTIRRQASGAMPSETAAALGFGSAMPVRAGIF